MSFPSHTNPDLDDESRQSVRLAYQTTAATDFMTFCEGLLIHTATGPKRFTWLMEPFQRETFELLTPSLVAVRDGEIPKRKRFWIERTKKSGKDSDVAICIMWLMAFPKRPLKCQVCAADQEQAGIVRERVLDLLYHNPWLNEFVEVKQNRIVNKTMPGLVWTRIESTDARGGSHGETPDVLILNELVHVAKWQAMEDHMSNADGTPNSLVIICTNAGIKGTRAWAWRQNALEGEERWKTLIWSEPSPWISQEDVDEAKRRDPIGAHFRRLFWGEWVSGIGDAVSDELINAVFCQTGPIKKPKPGMIYVGGLDLGVSRDHSGIAILEVDPNEQVVRTVRIRGFEPSLKSNEGKLEVDSAAVEKACWELSERFRISWFGFDPAAGGSFMAQRLRHRDVLMYEVKFNPTNLTAMATAFVQFLQDGQFECYNDPEGRLRRDFGKFSIDNRVPTGYKLESIRDEHGHADVGVAVVIALMKAKEILGDLTVERWREDDIIAFGGEEDDKPMTDKEIEAMPSDLEEIVQMSKYDEDGRRLDYARHRSADKEMEDMYREDDYDD